MPTLSQLTLTILDPTSALGRDVVQQLAADFPELKRRLYHTRGDEEHLVAEIRGEPALVPPLGEAEDLDGSAAVIVTAPPQGTAGEALPAWLVAHPDVALIDVTQPGIAPAESTHVLGGSIARRAGRRWYHMADPALAGPARVLAALTELEPEYAVVHVFPPASARGDEAVEELAAQGVARLSGAEAERPKVLPAVIAFDLLPGERERAAQLRAQLEMLCPGVRYRLHVVESGVFHGHGATLELRCRKVRSEDHVRALLRRTEGVRVARRNEVASVAVALDQDDVICAEVEVGGDSVGLWIVADGQRVAGARAVAALVSTIMAS